MLTLLALFDVSAAFDTVDHDILLERLHVTFGLSGVFLEWLGSFLSGRTLSVVHGPTQFRWVPAPYGLPQGSILGPLLCFINTSAVVLSTFLAKIGAQGQLYADDTQTYSHCRPANAPFAVRGMGHVLD